MTTFMPTGSVKSSLNLRHFPIVPASMNNATCPRREHYKPFVHNGREYKEEMRGLSKKTRKTLFWRGYELRFME